VPFRGIVPVIALALQLVSLPAGALAQVESVPPADMTPPADIARPAQQGPLLSGRLAVMAGLVLVTTFAGDQGLRGELQESRSPASNTVADVGNVIGDPWYVLPVLGAGALTGRLAGNAAVTLTALRAAGAVAVAGGVATAFKYAIGRRRPSSTGDADEFRPFTGWNSFPSGHTAVAFALATAIAEETRDPWTEAALYGAATLTAFARMNDDRHWASDVLAGALVGHLSARWLSRRHGVKVSPGAVTMSLEF
jgi:membrane-associated phospholipid phosphatase